MPTQPSKPIDFIIGRQAGERLKDPSKLPILIVTDEARNHATYNCCTMESLKKACIKVVYEDLGKEVMKGTGHMFFVVKDNMVTAERGSLVGYSNVRSTLTGLNIGSRNWLHTGVE
jgi:hypothetical protein